jgi:hypothetical protein
MAAQSILDRYEVTDDKQIIIDVSVRSIEDLYDNFDRTATYFKRDLDQDFVEHLVNCAREIGRYPFLLRISLGQPGPDEWRDRLRASIKNFFEYLRQVEIQSLSQLFRRSLVLLALGLLLLWLSVNIGKRIDSVGPIWDRMLAEGITIVAWISMWEACVPFLLDWHPHYKNIRLYRRITNAKVEFKEVGTINEKLYPK